MSEFADITLSFRRGDASLTLRAQNRVEMEGLIQDVEKSDVLLPFFSALSAGVVAGSSPAEATDASEAEETPDSGPASEDSSSTGVTPEEAQAAVSKHLGAGEERASATLVKVAAKKSGKSLEELDGISTTEAKRLISEGSK